MHRMTQVLLWLLSIFSFLGAFVVFVLYLLGVFDGVLTFGACLAIVFGNIVFGILMAAFENVAEDIHDIAEHFRAIDYSDEDDDDDD